MTRARDTANLIGSGNFSSTTFTATAGQTAFTISHTQGFVQVFMNGLLLDETADYTSNGTAITLTSGAAAGDEIEVVKYDTFSVGDAQTQAQADTRYLQTTGGSITGDLAVTTNANAKLSINDAIGEVGSGNLAFQSQNSAGSALKPMGFRAEDIRFATGGAERVRITDNGLTFNGDTAAANALDDYEEGTFNLEMVGYWGSPSPKIQIPAQYTKIGNTVHFWALKTAMNTTGYSGNMWFTGLPFNSPSPYSTTAGIYLSHIGTYTGYGPFLFISGTIAYALLHQSNASSWSAVMHNVVTSGGEVYISGTYKI